LINRSTPLSNKSSGALLRSIDISAIESQSSGLTSAILQREAEFASRDKLQADAEFSIDKSRALQCELESLELLKDDFQAQVATLEAEKSKFEAARAHEHEILKTALGVEIEELKRKLDAASESDKKVFAKSIKEAEQKFEEQVKSNSTRAERVVELLEQLESERKQAAARIAAQEIAAQDAAAAAEEVRQAERRKTAAITAANEKAARDAAAAAEEVRLFFRFHKNNITALLIERI